MPHKDRKKRNEYSRLWRLKHLDTERIRMREYRIKNHEKIRARERQHYLDTHPRDQLIRITHPQPPAHCQNCGKEIYYREKHCSKACMRETRYKIYIQNWKNGLENGTRGITGTHELVRKYIFEKYNNKCSSCGWSEINPFTKKIPLEVNHIDGKYNNNQESNLELICPNCHSLTKTYRSGNRGNGRPYIRGRIK